ncbi:MAG: ABC transporter ATP-binding protein [Gemmatimonadales bacterium]|nr:MAG: ABC transporter ATP-binding protein [Gemmatimonadales bacterium]
MGAASANPPPDPDAASAAPLRAVGLVRTFGAQRAVDGVSFTLESGRFLSLFGPNGAGKSTLLRLLSGALRPTAGELRLGPELLRTREPGWQHRIGVLSHQTFLYGHLTARENLRFFGDLYDLDDLEERIDAGLAAVDLVARGDDQVRTYSRGMRQRLALARTLLHDPDVVLLDEPFTGLDAHASAVLKGVLEALRDGRRTVVMVTHNLTEGLEMADIAAIQVRGRLAYWESAEGLEAAGFPGLYRETVEASA